MITPISPLVVNKNRRASFPQKLIRIVEKYVKKCITTIINVILNIFLLFKSFVISVINSKYFWDLSNI